MNKNYKPVILDSDKCNGCVSCMKRCPTEAIRVRGRKAAIMYERCVGCGECVKVCPTHAKKECFDTLDMLKDYKYTVALPSPSIYGQFNNLKDVNYILTGLKSLGFDDVFEVAVGSEIVSAATKQYLKSDKVVRPLINSACPAITNLILMRYEHLVAHLSPIKSPEVVSAELAIKKALKDTGLRREDIGIFIITQCGAVVMETKRHAEGLIDGALSFKEIYVPLLNIMNKLTAVEPLSDVGKLGISWGCCTGEAVGLGTENFLAADGVENVFSVLNDLEHEKLNNLDFLELYACTSGCVGGSMNIENPFLARTRLRLLRKNYEIKTRTIEDFDAYFKPEQYIPNNIFKLDENRAEAMRKMLLVKQIYAQLPQLDCGACGAPCCMALAEDIAKGLDVRCVYKSEVKL